MEVTTKELENRQAILTAKVEDEWLDPFLRTASRSLATRFEIPGFRKGKAPHQVVVQRMGKEALVREVIDDLGRAAYDEAVEESGLEPIRLEDFEIAEWAPLTLRMTVSLKPIIELGDYRSQPVELEEVEGKDEDAEAVLRDLQERYAERVSVDRPAALGDFALLDVEGSLEGRVVLQLEQQEYELRADADFPVGEFAEKLAGVPVGEQVSFDLTFPDDYEDEDLAGHEATLRVHLHSLQEKVLPEIDDELAKMVAGLGSLEELTEKIREDLYLHRDAELKDQLAEELLGSVAEETQVDSPPLFVDAELETMMRMIVRDLQEQGLTLEGYLKTSGRTIENLLDEFRPTAEKRVKESLVLSKLVEVEDIEVEDAEIEEEVARITDAYGQDTEGLRDALLSNEHVREDIRNRLYGRKIVERLAELSSLPEATDEASVAAQGEEYQSEVEDKPVSVDEAASR